MEVVDFSEAERSGFILAFAKFRCKRGDSRTQDQLLADGAKLLKGCEQHFHNAVTRIKRIGSIIPVEDEKKFKNLAMKLCSVPNQEGFEAIAHRIVKKWPRTSTWLAWWTRESHASMIFKSQQIMDAEVWDSIPGSTNAEEAMHWKLYSGAGRNHDVIEGFEGLLSMADYYKRLNDAALGELLNHLSLFPSQIYKFQLVLQPAMDVQNYGNYMLRQLGVLSHLVQPSQLYPVARKMMVALQIHDKNFIVQI